VSHETFATLLQLSSSFVRFVLFTVRLLSRVFTIYSALVVLCSLYRVSVIIATFVLVELNLKTPKVACKVKPCDLKLSRFCVFDDLSRCSLVSFRGLVL